MEHSVSAYLGRLPKKKAAQLWKQWIIDGQIPPHISPDLVEILKLRLKELEKEQTSP